MIGILTAVTSLLSGGLTGIIGAGVQRFFDYKNKAQDIEVKKLEFQNNIEVKKLDIQIMDREWEHRTAVAKIEGDAKIEVADSEAFGQSVFKEPTRYSKATDSLWMIILDFIRGIVRPGLTVYLCVLTTMIYLESKTIIAAAKYTMSVDQAIDIYSLIVNTILYLTTTCVLWWFGTRNKNKPPKQGGA